MSIAAFLLSLLLAAQDLEKPVRIEAGGAPIATETGHSGPYVHDFDRDGVRDLLVGQFGGGKLRIYRNLGSNDKPRFDAFTWFEAGGKVATVDAG